MREIVELPLDFDWNEIKRLQRSNVTLSLEETLQAVGNQWRDWLFGAKSGLKPGVLGVFWFE